MLASYGYGIGAVVSYGYGGGAIVPPTIDLFRLQIEAAAPNRQIKAGAPNRQVEGEFPNRQIEWTQ